MRVHVGINRTKCVLKEKEREVNSNLFLDLLLFSSL
jgi:hypothetical protein